MKPIKTLRKLGDKSQEGSTKSFKPYSEQVALTVFV
jgi:hypothetical protein